MSARIAIAFATLVSSAAAQCGEWSPAFEVGGLGANAVGYDVAVYDDGNGAQLYAGGRFAGALGDPRPHLVRWDGQHWSSIGAPDHQVGALIVFDDGSGSKLYVGGRFSTIGSTATGRVASWDGSSLQPVGDLATLDVLAFAIHDDGGGARLYACGSLQVSDVDIDGRVVRLDAGGWTVVGEADEPIGALHSFDDGSGPALAVGGNFLEIGAQPIRRLARLQNGAWSSLAGDANGPVMDFATYDDGSGPALYIGGYFQGIGGNPNVPRLAKWDGSSITAVPGFTSASSSVSTLSTYDAGSGEQLLVGGGFTSVASTAGTRGIALWDGTTWSALGTGISAQSFSVFDTAAWNDGGGTGLVVTGSFESAGEHATEGIALWRNGAWSALGRETGVRGDVLAWERFDAGGDDGLVLGGKFRFAGGELCNNVARWDGQSLSALGGGVTFANFTSGTPSVHALCTFDAGTGPELYVGGRFDVAGGQLCANLARWNGTSWSPMSVVGTSAVVTSMCVHDDGTGPALYIGGNHFTIQGSRNVAKWNGTSWMPLSTGCIAVGGDYEPISALASYDDGGGSQLYAGGQLFVAGATNVFYLARWNGLAWSSVGTGIDAPYTNTSGVTSLHVANLGSGTKLYVGGGFDAAGGSPATNLAVWDGAWSAVASTSAAQPSRVLGIESFDAGDGNGTALYVASSFVADDGLPTHGIARFDASGSSTIAAGIEPVPPFTTPFAGPRMAVFDDGVDAGEDLYVGGTFRGADGTLCLGMGRLRGCGEVGTSFCFGDGSSTACPCGNASAVGDRAGCLNSLGTGGTVRARGVASVSNDTLVLDGGGMTNSSVLYFQGASLVNGGAGTTFGDGLRCVGGPLVRLGSKENVAGASSYPVGADLSISTKGFVTTAVTRHYSARYRNPAAFCTPDTFNYTSAVTIAWRL